MSDEVIVLKTFNNEIEAGMAQQVLQEAGMTAFVFKDDAGGMEPQLQRTNGVRLGVTGPTANMHTRCSKRDLTHSFGALIFSPFEYLDICAKQSSLRFNLWFDICGLAHRR